MSVLVVTGTGAEVSKTVTTSAIAALAIAQEKHVAVLKPAQVALPSGKPGDLDQVQHLADGVTVREVRYPASPLPVAVVLYQRKLACAGVVIGYWSREPDVAARYRRYDLPVVTGAPFVRALPEKIGNCSQRDFLHIACRSLAPVLGGQWDNTAFTAEFGTAS